MAGVFSGHSPLSPSHPIVSKPGLHAEVTRGYSDLQSQLAAGIEGQMCERVWSCRIAAPSLHTASVMHRLTSSCPRRRFLSKISAVC